MDRYALFIDRSAQRGNGELRIVSRPECKRHESWFIGAIDEDSKLKKKRRVEWFCMDLVH